jgi:ABC-type uncharacterized transport system permease subunit
MDSLFYTVLPQILLLVFGGLLGVWAILLRRADLQLEKGARRIGRVGAALYLVWLVGVTIHQHQLPMLNPGQLALFLGGLVWFGQCWVQRSVDQRLFALLPLLGVVLLTLVGVVLGLRPGAPAEQLLGWGAAIHVTLSLAGIALLLGCGVFGAGHVILHRNIRNRSFNAWFQRLPSLGDLDRLRRRSLIAGWVLVTVSLLSALAWAARQPADRDVIVSHLHPMILLAVILLALVAADRFRLLSANKLAAGCVIMSAVVLGLLGVSVVEIFAGRVAA